MFKGNLARLESMQILGNPQTGAFPRKRKKGEVLLKLKKLTALVVLPGLALSHVVGVAVPASASASCVVDQFTDGAGSDVDGQRTIRFCLGSISNLGTITFSHGGTSKEIEVSSSLSITGKQVTIDGDELVTIRRSASANTDFSLLTSDSFLYIDGITFRGGRSLNGGAINTGTADVEIIRTQFIDNRAASDGGAIFADDATIRNSFFDSNEAGNLGGAIYTRDDMIRVEDSTFTGNRAARGGALYAGGDADIYGSLFTNNSATERGGAVYADSDIDAIQSSFVSNSAANGGALYTEDNDTDIRGSYFGLNSATLRGGAISIEQHIRIRNSTFYQNSSSGEGGAIFNNTVDSDTGYIQTSTFVDNESGSGLSAIFWGQNNEFHLFGNLFLGEPGQRQLNVHVAQDRTETRIVDRGWNVATAGDFLNSPSSNTNVTLASLGAGVPETATLTVRPFVPFSSLRVVGVEITQAALTAWDEGGISPDLSTLEFDQQGVTRVLGYFPGAQFIAYLAPEPTVSAVALPEYEGPVIQQVVPNVNQTSEVKVIGLRMNTVDEVSVQGKALPKRVDSNGVLYFDTSSLASGTYRVEFWSSIASTRLYSLVSIVTRGDSPSSALTPGAKLNVGSFNGKLVVYAAGLDGARISWKVGGNWGSQVAVGNTLNRFDRPTPRRGVTVSVEIYVNGVKQLTKSVVTR